MKSNPALSYEIVDCSRETALRVLKSALSAGHTDLFEEYSPHFAVYHICDGKPEAEGNR